MASANQQLYLYFSPKEHPWISQQEKDFIEKSLPDIYLRQEDQKKSKVPWTKIIFSKCVWGVVAGHLASNWGNYQLNSLLPTYLSTVLR